MIGVRPSSRNPKEAVVVMVVEQLPCSPREVSSKEECRSSDLWERRMFQVSDKYFLWLFPKRISF